MEDKENNTSIENVNNDFAKSEYNLENLEEQENKEKFSKEEEKIDLDTPEQKICPKCNNICDKEDLFCNKCGCKFTILEKEQKLLCPQCGKEYTLEDYFCKNCGFELKTSNKCPQCGTIASEGDIYCGECGYKLQSYTTGNVAPKTQTITYSNNSTICRFCGSRIPKGVQKCPHCREWLKGGDHFGCASLLMWLIIIFCIIISLGIFSLQIPLPYIGELTSASAFIIVCITWAYLLPALIADWRGQESKLGIFFVNLFFGWTIIGWFVALVLAFSGRKR